VHALQNYFSAKLLLDPEKTYETLVTEINERLPQDIRLFSILNVVGGYDAKKAASWREYDYYMPTFMLSPDVKVKYELSDEQPEQNFDPDNFRSTKRVRVTLDQSEIQEMYDYRLPQERREILEKLLAKYVGTHKFHNYTKQGKAKDKNMQRFMMDINVLEYKVYDGIEFARVFLRGQSFLYNQIRKMMGGVFLIMHYGLPESFIDNTLKDNDVNVPTAPGEGLMLNRVAYDRYNNNRKKDIPEPVKPWDSKTEELENFRIGLVNYI